MSAKLLKTEFGDFQTPLKLAREIAELVKTLFPRPSTVVEPTAGVGSFLVAASEAFPDSEIFGYEINHGYVAIATEATRSLRSRVTVLQADFFDTNWERLVGQLRSPTLFIGNPPWVTNSKLGAIEGTNVPLKSNFQGHNGFEARTGKSNFDISEWMLIQLLKSIERTGSAVAFLVKSAVARKLFLHSMKSLWCLGDYRCYKIDAKQHFGVAADACLFFCRGKENNDDIECPVFSSIAEAKPDAVIGYREGRLVADLSLFDRNKSFYSPDSYEWRSGIKHDVARVLELTKEGGVLRNGYDVAVDIESTFLFPLLKSSDLGSDRGRKGEKWVIVPQRRIGESTARIESEAPKTWKYLMEHQGAFELRKSSIYRGAYPFSIFGVGDYSFAPWKVAISSLYRNVRFQAIGPLHDRPVMLDDTCYFFPCSSREQAEVLVRILQSRDAQDLLISLTFYDSKRIVTKDQLGALDLNALARVLKIGQAYDWRRPSGGVTSRALMESPEEGLDTRPADLFDGILMREDEALWSS